MESTISGILPLLAATSKSTQPTDATTPISTRAILGFIRSVSGLRIRLPTNSAPLMMETALAAVMSANPFIIRCVIPKYCTAQ